uniref:Retrovirus-related Pol polyprotein from transposon TNT 1-94 n=1 Tax=Tanacetum cinerariifolium TaxID=118510 RepID=A0A6L2LMS5_TANCI|nr:retrovirus-related Pol polyprotein from transposon TNT 1-94 [Tanacetum cinerariifolium]
MESVRAINERFANTAYGFFLRKRVAYLVVANYFSSIDGLDAMLKNGPWFIHNSPLILKRSSYARALIEVRADVELKYNIVVVMPKLVGEGFYTCNVRVEQVSKKKNVNTSGNKKNDVEPTIEVNNSNPFDVLNSVENDVDLGTNGGTSNLASKKANCSRSSFSNVESSSTSTTPIAKKIDKMERIIIDGKVTLVDDEGKPLTRVAFLGDHDCADEVASVDYDMANFLASKKVGYGANSLLEQLKESYVNGDYDFNPYDDDMYEGHDTLDKIQDTYNNLDIKVRGQMVSRGSLASSKTQGNAIAIIFDVVAVADLEEAHRRFGGLTTSNRDCWRSNSNKWYQELWFAGFSGYLGSIKKGSLWPFFLEGVEGFSDWATRSKAKGDDGERLYVRGRTDRRDSRQSRGKSRSKSRGGRLKCYICQSDDHLKRNYLKNNRKKSTEALLDLIMDSGCSYHMTPRLDIFFDFLEYDWGSVLLGDNKECKITCIGKVRVQLRDGPSFVLNNVRVVLSGTRKENYVYSLDGNAVAGELNASVDEKDSLAQVWHKRLGHISEAGLHVLEKQGLFGKESQDLWGPSHVESLGGKRYFLSIVDDYFKRTGRTVKKLRTDNGLEFYNREFEQLCNESEIARQSTVVGTPQQNGLAERMNRTLMDKVPCLLIQSGLPKTFWAEATCTTTIDSDCRKAWTTIEKKTPMEMWPGHPSDYGMLRIFGCVAYLHVKQGKLEPRAIKCVLLRYPEGVKGYRLYRLDGESPKIVTSRNVVFNKSVMSKDTLKDSGADGDDEDVGDQETDQTPDLTDYQLTQDREPRTRIKPLRRNGFSEEEQDLGVSRSSSWTKAVRRTSIRVILALTACKDYELEQLDVKTAFLHGNLEEVIYMRQPLGYEQGNKVCLLKKSLYGLKQSPRQWYRRFDEYMLSNGFKRSSYDSYVYYRSYAPGEYIYLLLYVDDMLIACKSNVEIGSTKSLLKREFDMKDLGEAKKILGMKIVKDRSRKIMKVTQSRYISKILNNFRIDNGKSVQMLLSGHFKLSSKDCSVRDCDIERMSMVSYANAVGSLMYLMVCTRPDIAYAVSVVSRYLANSGKNHWEAVKWILKYLRGTANVGLVYGTDRGNHMNVTSFVDSDYSKDPKKEAEYIAFKEAVKEAIWLRGLLKELGVELNTVAVNCDNQDEIHLSQFG